MEAGDHIRRLTNVLAIVYDRRIACLKAARDEQSRELVRMQGRTPRIYDLANQKELWERIVDSDLDEAWLVKPDVDASFQLLDKNHKFLISQAEMPIEGTEWAEMQSSRLRCVWSYAPATD